MRFSSSACLELPAITKVEQKDANVESARHFRCKDRHYPGAWANGPDAEVDESVE
jgi:hypothetical protein